MIHQISTIDQIKNYVRSLPNQIFKPENDRRVSQEVTVHYLNEFGVIGPDGTYYLYENLTPYELNYIYNRFTDKFTIRFDVTGTVVQNIIILTGESKEDFFAKIKGDKYLVSLMSNLIYDLSHNIVGYCNTIDVEDHSTYDNFVADWEEDENID